jgi:translocation and assembly module TamA
VCDPRSCSPQTHWVRGPARAVLAALGLFAALTAPARAPADVKVQVSVDGVDGGLAKNVLASIELHTASQQGALPEAEALRLYQRAPRQAARALEPFGYYGAEVRDTLDESSKPWRARFHVNPGPPTILTAVDVRVEGPGASHPAFRKATSEFTLKPGSRLEHAPYEALKQALQNAAASNGYLDARFAERRVEVDRVAHRGQILLRYETGPQFFFGDVRITQNVLDSAIVYAQLPIVPGKPFDSDSLIALQNRLTRSPYFSSVEVESRRDLADSVTMRVPIEVTLVGGKRLGYTLGAGYGTDTGPLVKGSLEFRRLNRSGHRGQIEGILSDTRQGIGAQYALPRARGETQTLTFLAGYEFENTETEKSQGYQVGARVERLIDPWHLLLGLIFLRQKFTVGLDEGNPHLLTPDLQIQRIDTNNRIYPRDGRSLSFRARGASDEVLSDAAFVQLQAQGKWIRSWGERWRAIGKAEVGRTYTDQFHDLPPDIRYFAGGATDVRAFGYEELGPSDASGEPTGGDTRALGSVDLEFRMREKLALAAFYDVGGAFLENREAIGDGAGGGIRWISPVGMVRLDLAWAIRDAGIAVSRPQFQLSIGPDF